MTRKRIDEHSTEFGLWLRDQKEIDSSIGFITTNLDYIWCNYKTGEWMLIEEKRHNANISYTQQTLFDKVNKLCQSDNLYRGFHKLVFENTSPDDGLIYLDSKSISKSELLNFLKFK